MFGSALMLRLVCSVSDEFLDKRLGRGLTLAAAAEGSTSNETFCARVIAVYSTNMSQKLRWSGKSRGICSCKISGKALGSVQEHSTERLGTLSRSDSMLTSQYLCYSVASERRRIIPFTSATPDSILHNLAFRAQEPIARRLPILPIFR